MGRVGELCIVAGDLGGSASHLAYDFGGAMWSGCLFLAKRSWGAVAIRGRCGQAGVLSDSFVAQGHSGMKLMLLRLMTVVVSR